MHSRRTTGRRIQDFLEHDQGRRQGRLWFQCRAPRPLARFTGVAIFETDDPAAIANWVLNWNSILDCKMVPVLDDDEASAVGKARLG
ncbi:MAG: DUF3303 family protein [Gemmatimonadetes bacterium]|nr:DUF3303 family protein [Gemmatimonadota bacterium]